MPVKEIDLQTDLKKAVIDAGGFAYKQSNRFLVGVLDLFIQLPMRPTVLLEVKYEKDGPRRDGKVNVNLSPHQIRNMNSINLAGGVAGWIMITRGGPGEYGWVVGRVAPSGPVRAWKDDHFYKRRGQPWPILRIIQEVIESC